MLKGLTKPKLSPETAPSHEDLFMQRYERLLKAARRLTNGGERAQDLVHNAFVQFMLSRPEIASIQDLDGYLLIMLRNMNVSQARRAAIVQTVALSATDYDSAEAGLRAADAHTQLQVREQLRLTCQYACRRKERSKIGSALILRFFHGYYPSEVAQVFRSTRNVVDKWLSLARHEALVYVEDPSSLKLIEGQPEAAIPDSRIGVPVAAFLSELRNSIFLARNGDCRNEAELKQIYSNQPADMSTEYLSHIVSCARCLDSVNTLLDLPSLAERFPMETFGRDPRPPGGSGPGEDGGTGMSGGGDISKLKQISRRRVSDVLEHRPKELRVAVNGYVLGSQSVSAESNNLALSVNLTERVGFVEVFSEQGICLLFSSIGAPPDGPLEQEAHVKFSEGRTLDLNLNFSGPWPTVNVAYHDPALGLDDATRTEPIQVPEQVTALPPTPVLERESRERRIGEPVKRTLSKLGQTFGNWSFWLRPGTATAVIAILAITALVFVKFHRGPEPAVTAADLLNRAGAEEQAIAARIDQVQHRTVNLEERSAAGTLISSRRVDVWQSAQRGISARRLYDEKGVLIAGDWRRADGVQALYSHSSRPRIKPVPEKQASVAALLNFENAWQFLPSAKEFSSLVVNVGNSGNLHVEERATEYLISYSRTEPGSEATGLVKATLVLSRADLHSTEQTLTVRQGNELREYRMIETSFERRPVDAVAPKVFEPESELLSERMKDEGGRMNKDADSASPLPLASSPAVATADLEVEVLHLLNQAGADLGEQVDVVRAPDGLLHVTGLVETDERKREIQRALGPVISSGAVKFAIRSVAEVIAQQQRGRERSAAVPSVQGVEVAADTFPAYKDLRTRFSDAEAHAFASRMISRSRKAMRHAAALKQLLNQFSVEDLRTLSPEARTKLFALIRIHARAFEQETSNLKEELRPIFLAGSGDAGGQGGDLEVSDDAGLRRAIERLFALGAENDRAISSAFAVSAGNASSTLKTSQFWELLRSAEKLATRIQNAR